MVEVSIPGIDYPVLMEERATYPRVVQVYSVKSREDAEKIKDDFLSAYGGNFNPYSGHAYIIDEHTVQCERWHSCD